MNPLIRSTATILIVIIATQAYQVSARRQHCALSNEVEELLFVFKENTTTTSAQQVPLQLTKNKTALEQYYEKDELTTTHVRACICGGAISQYCFDVNDVDWCSVSWDYWTDTWGATYCYKRSSVYSQFMELLWMPALFFFSIAIVMPITTILGRNATEYVLSPCFPCIRNRRINRIITNEIESITNYIDVQNSFGSRDDGMVEQTVLKLRTKSVEETSGKDFSDDDLLCMICMGPFEQGEKIGDLSCGHTYHVDCLKEWLKRKNACPLCDSQVADARTVLVNRNEVFADDNGEVDEEARSRFQYLLTSYHRRTMRRLNAGTR